MFRLNEEQIAIITQDVKNEGITFSHLEMDLIDHICCDIESRMSHEISFETAYGYVKKEFNIRGLRQIQQDTLMLIDKNYRIMKKSMKWIGVIAMALMAFGALFKIFHWPGASVLLVGSFAFTLLLFFPALLYTYYKEANKQKQSLFYFLVFIGGATFMSGVLFKLLHFPGAGWLLFMGLGLISLVILPVLLFIKLKQAEQKKTILWFGFLPLIVFTSGILLKLLHLPGASILLSIGSIFLIVIFIPLYYFTEVKNSKKVRTDFIFMIIAFTYFIVLSFLLQMNLSKGVPENPNFQNSSIEKTSEFILNKNSELAQQLDDSTLQDFVSSSQLLHHEIENIKLLIVQKNNQVSNKQALIIADSECPLSDYFKSSNYLLSEKNPYSPLPKLKENIKNYLASYKPISQKLKDPMQIAELFNIDDTQWEKAEFSKNTDSGVLTKLSLWQKEIQWVQFQTLNSMTQISKN